MNKSELIAAVADRSAITKTAAANALNALTNTVIERIHKGESVNIIGFGSWEVVRREPRVARNPQTGDEIRLPAHNVAKFTPGKSLKDALNA